MGLGYDYQPASVKIHERGKASMDTGLQGKVAIVTGGASGLGRATSRLLVAEGARVVLPDIKEVEARQFAQELTDAGAEALAVKCDVTNQEQVQTMVEEVIGTLGAVDVLVNNAGVAGPQGPWHKLKEADFDRVMDINFRSVYFCCKAVTPHMIERDGGKIINIASVAGKTGEDNNGIYCVTKTAVISLTQSMALEVGKYNINVNAVCPGMMDTDLMKGILVERSPFYGLTPEELHAQNQSNIPLTRMLTTEDVAHVVVFLASNKTDMMTGQAVNITAGIEVH